MLDLTTDASSFINNARGIENFITTAMKRDIAAHIGAAIIASVTGVFGSLKLIERHTIGEPSFVVLVVFAVLVSLLIAFMWKIDSFKASVSSIEVKLRQIQEAESSIKNLGSAMLELAEANEDGYKQPTWDRDKYENAKKQLRGFTQ